MELRQIFIGQQWEGPEILLTKGETKRIGTWGGKIIEGLKNKPEKMKDFSVELIEKWKIKWWLTNKKKKS